MRAGVSVLDRGRGLHVCAVLVFVCVFGTPSRRHPAGDRPPRPMLSHRCGQRDDSVGGHSNHRRGALGVHGHRDALQPYDQAHSIVYRALNKNASHVRKHVYPTIQTSIQPVYILSYKAFPTAAAVSSRKKH